MSTDKEIRQVFEDDIARKTADVVRREGLIALLKGATGMTVRKLDKYLNEVVLFDLEQGDDFSPDD